MIGHIARVAASLLRERAKRKKRSPQWRAVERAFKKANSTCAACGGKTFLQVHHIEPVSNRPSRELDQTNLITLCMGANDCHLFLGHGGAFKFYNPRVVEHAFDALTRPAYMRELRAKARAVRLD